MPDVPIVRDVAPLSTHRTSERERASRNACGERPENAAVNPILTERGDDILTIILNGR